MRPLTDNQILSLKDVARHKKLSDVQLRMFDWRSFRGLYERGLVAFEKHCLCQGPCGCRTNGLSLTEKGREVVAEIKKRPR